MCGLIFVIYKKVFPLTNFNRFTMSNYCTILIHDTLSNNLFAIEKANCFDYIMIAKMFGVNFEVSHDDNPPDE